MENKKMDVGVDLVISPEAIQEQIKTQKAIWAFAKKNIIGRIDSMSKFEGITPDLQEKLDGLRQKVEAVDKKDETS